MGILLGVTAGPAHGYQTAPASGGDARYRSVVIAIDPPAPGVSASIVGDDNLVRLDNRSPSTVVVLGYSGDQYARLLPDGTVQLNLRSPAFYLNEYGSKSSWELFALPPVALLFALLVFDSLRRGRRARTLGRA